VIETLYSLALDACKIDGIVKSACDNVIAVYKSVAVC
jgi:hypothetical protein